VQWRIKIILNQVSCRNHGQKKRKEERFEGILSNFAIGHLITFCFTNRLGKKCWLLNFFVFVEKTKVNFVPRNCDE